MRDAFEHRRWPPPGSDELDSWGNEAFQSLATTLNLFRVTIYQCNFDMQEALYQWSRLKKKRMAIFFLEILTEISGSIYPDISVESMVIPLHLFQFDCR
jgi:hypothetical protein